MPVSTANPPELLNLKRSLARSMKTRMRAENLSVTKVAALLRTNRTAVKRVLDGNNTSISLKTMFKATDALGLKLSLTTRPKTPRELRDLATQLVEATKSSEVDAITEKLVAGFYGR